MIFLSAEVKSCTHTLLLHYDEHRANAWHRLPFLSGESAKGCEIMLKNHNFVAILFCHGNRWTVTCREPAHVDFLAWDQLPSPFSLILYIEQAQPGPDRSLRLNDLSRWSLMLACPAIHQARHVCLKAKFHTHVGFLACFRLVRYKQVKQVTGSPWHL